MGKMILVTGGARSGKSHYAEQIMKSIEGKILYIATAIAYDDEMKLRIKKHKEQRPDIWDTYEGHRNLGSIIRQNGNKYKGILLDCITIMTTNLMFDYSEDKEINEVDYEEIERKILKNMKEMVKGIKETNADVVLVTNELGSGVVPESKLGRVFRDIAGRVNQYLGQNAEEVYLTVCGIPVKVK